MYHFQYYIYGENCLNKVWYQLFHKEVNYLTCLKGRRKKIIKYQKRSAFQDQTRVEPLSRGRSSALEALRQIRSRCKGLIKGKEGTSHGAVCLVLTLQRSRTTPGVNTPRLSSASSFEKTPIQLTLVGFTKKTVVGLKETKRYLCWINDLTELG